MGYCPSNLSLGFFFPPPQSQIVANIPSIVPKYFQNYTLVSFLKVLSKINHAFWPQAVISRGGCSYLWVIGDILKVWRNDFTS